MAWIQSANSSLASGSTAFEPMQGMPQGRLVTSS